MVIFDDEWDGVERRKEMRHIAEMIGDIKTSIEEINKAFPDGTIEHRKAHEAMINAAKAQQAFWDDLKLDIAKKGVWGLLIIIIGLVLVGLSTKLGLGSVK